MISEYLDVDDTMRRLKALVAQPVRGLRHDAMLDVLNYFETKCTASKEITERAKRRIPGGVQHNLAFNYPFPLAIEAAHGAHLTDRDATSTSTSCRPVARPSWAATTRRSTSAWPR